MRNTIAAAVLLSVCLSAAQTASAQSALRRLAETIRAQRAAAADDAEAVEGENRAQQPTPAAESTPGDAMNEPGYLGVVVDDRQDRGRGVRILQVLPGGPAEKAGLKVQDLITSVGDIRVRQMDEVIAIFQQMRPGDVLGVEILRGEARRQVSVTFGRRPKPQVPRIEPADRPTLAPTIELPTLTEIEPLVELVPAVSPTPEAPFDVQAQIEMLKRRIEELQQRVEHLERALLDRDY